MTLTPSSIAHALDWIVRTIVVLFLLSFPFWKWLGDKIAQHFLSRDLKRYEREQQEALTEFKSKLDAEQQQKLQAYKSEQDRELERLRRLLSRGGKLDERELEVLPKAWAMLNELHGHVQRGVDLTWKGYPDFNNFSAEKLEAFLSSLPADLLTDFQKSELLKTEDKHEYYMDEIKSRYVDQAQEQHRLLTNFLIEHRLFIPNEIHEQFSALNQALYSSLTGYTIGVRAGNFELENSAIQKMLNDVPGMIEALGQTVRNNLYRENA